ncbi:ribbon-helix-helix protein, CopG family [Novosphingobium sp. NDB2Meth1]|nr:ribbon-helix-helix protein, CopG family [Novosphingobium sp. NDB2Meth1]
MRNQVHDGTVVFRANSAVIAALSERARRSGCSVSEYLRAVVREKVGLQ